MKKIALKYWHQTKNKPTNYIGKKPPMDMSFWWICPRGHEWQESYSKVGRCQICSSQRKPSAQNNLTVLRPDLAAQWHPKLNGDMTPGEITPGSNKKIWWRCKNNHEWQAKVNDRKRGRNCPECSNQKAGLGNNLAVLRPDLAAQWHPKLNAGLTPRDVVAGSNKKVWWQCENGHEWQARIEKRAVKCPKCPQLKLSESNNLAALNPHITAQWHPTLNGSLTPRDVIADSHKVVWWLCPKGHEWQAKIYNRGDESCPKCSSRRLREDNNLVALRPDIAAQWHPTLNGSLTPRDVVPGSNKKVWWFCSKGHEWQTQVRYRTYGTNCLQCINLKVGKDNNLAVLRPDLAAQWHPTLNGDLTSKDVVAGSRKKVWWQCENGHEWKERVCERSDKCRKCTQTQKASLKKTAYPLAVH